MNGKKVCLLLNYAPHYREEIFLLLEENLNATFFLGNETLAPNIKKMNYSLFRKTPVELRFTRIFKNFSWLRNSIPQVFKNEFETFIITGEPYCVSSWFVLFAAKINGKKILPWTHGWYGREKGLKKILKKIYFGLSNGVLLYGQYAREKMIEEGFPKEKLHVIYNSMHYSKQVRIRRTLEKSNVFRDIFGNNRPVIIFVGRITAKKKLNLLVDAFELAMKGNGKKFNVVLVGAGEHEVNHLTVAVEKSGFSAFWKFLGPCYDENLLGNYFFNADICVLPGEAGLTGIHSMGYGTPVITHNNLTEQMPEFEAIIPGVTGDFFIQESPESMADTIERWLDRFPEKSNFVSANCMEVIDTYFNPKYQLKIISDLIERS